MAFHISTNKSFRLSWNILLALLIVYSVLVIPFLLGFDLDDGSIFVTIGLVINFIFLIDMALNFITPYFHKGLLITNRHRIAKHYLKSWFIIDLLATIPFDDIVMWIWPDTASWAVSLALFRLLRIIRIYRFLHNLVRNVTFNPALMRILELGFSILFSVHIIACVWFFLGSHPVLEYDYPSWVIKNELIDKPVFVQYIRSLYWVITTMATVGYGDIVPLNPGETIFAMLVMLIGASVFAYIIANMASLIANLDATAAVFRKKMQTVSNYTRSHGIPKYLYTRIHEYFNQMLIRKTNLFEGDPLEGLPRSIKLEIALYIHREVVQKVPLFQDVDSGVINAVVLMLKSEVYLPGDIIIEQGNIGREMYFLTLGKVNVLDEKTSTECATLEQGSFFGEIALLHKHVTRTRTIRARGHVECSVLKKEDFDLLLNSFPSFAEKIRKIAASREAELPKPN